MRAEIQCINSVRGGQVEGREKWKVKRKTGRGVKEGSGEKEGKGKGRRIGEEDRRGYSFGGSSRVIHEIFLTEDFCSPMFFKIVFSSFH